MIGLAIMLAASGISSGNDLYAACKSGDDIEIGMCIGFITGVTSGVQTDREIAKVPPAWCIRKGVTQGQMRDITLKFMEDDPSIRDQDAAGIVIFAMARAFPCPKSS
jgi:hypothetical protein